MFPCHDTPPAFGTATRCLLLQPRNLLLHEKLPESALPHGTSRPHPTTPPFDPPFPPYIHSTYGVVVLPPPSALGIPPLGPMSCASSSLVLVTLPSLSQQENTCHPGESDRIKSNQIVIPLTPFSSLHQKPSLGAVAPFDVLAVIRCTLLPLLHVPSPSAQVTRGFTQSSRPRPRISTMPCIPCTYRVHATKYILQSTYICTYR